MTSHTITSAAKQLGTSWKLIRELLYEHDLGERYGKDNRLVRFSDEDVVKLGELVTEHKAEVQRKLRAGMTVKGPGAGHGQGRTKFQAPILAAAIEYKPVEVVYEEVTLNGARYLRRVDAGKVFNWRASC